jgi:hypothetical protein
MSLYENKEGNLNFGEIANVEGRPKWLNIVLAGTTIYTLICFILSLMEDFNVEIYRQNATYIKQVTFAMLNIASIAYFFKSKIAIAWVIVIAWSISFTWFVTLMLEIEKANELDFTFVLSYGESIFVWAFFAAMQTAFMIGVYLYSLIKCGRNHKVKESE